MWLYTSPDPVLGAEITWASSSGNRKAKAPRVEINCGVADDDSLGFELKLACF
jgi:hypothetical protein